MKNTLMELYFSLVGYYSIAQVIGMGIFMALGITLSIAIQYLIRGTKNENTPDGFDLLFWIKDNKARTIALVIVGYLSIRFSNELFGNPLTELRAVFYGLTIDKTLETFINYFKNSEPPEIKHKSKSNKIGK